MRRRPTAMRDHIDSFLDQTTLVALALAIAVGWSLFQVAKGVADFVNGLLTKYPPGTELSLVANSQPATWIVHGRLLTFTTFIEGAVEFAFVVFVAVWVGRQSRGGSPSQ